MSLLHEYGVNGKFRTEIALIIGAKTYCLGLFCMTDGARFRAILWLQVGAEGHEIVLTPANINLGFKLTLVLLPEVKFRVEMPGVEEFLERLFPM